MPIVDIIDRVTEWADKNICAKVKLKLPNDDNGDSGYNGTYELVKPAAFAMYVPPSDRLPEGIKSPVPSVCVRILEGEDNLVPQRGKINIQLCFSTWDTGYHDRDFFIPKKGEPGAFENKHPDGNANYYRRNGDGWRDAWNFVDVALRELESAENIDGIPIDKTAIKYGTFKEQENIPDYYPLWFAWVNLSLEYILIRNRPGEEFL